MPGPARQASDHKRPRKWLFPPPTVNENFFRKPLFTILEEEGLSKEPRPPRRETGPGPGLLSLLLTSIASAWDSVSPNVN